MNQKQKTQLTYNVLRAKTSMRTYMELHQSLNYIAVLLAEESSLHYVNQLGIRIKIHLHFV